LESSIKRRESEISSLNESLKRQGIEKDDIEHQRLELSSKLQLVDDELVNEKSDRENLFKQKKKVEDEVAELRKIIESEGNQQSKQVEIQKLRDQEIASLKSQLSSAQTEIEDTRRKKVPQQSNLLTLK